MSTLHRNAHHSLKTSTILTSALAIMAMGQPALAADGIIGGTVVVGAADIAQSQTGTGLHTEINSHADRTMMEFTRFSVLSGDSANINQNKSGIFLAHDGGSFGASQIDGALSSPGQVIIVNGQGVMFGAGAQVNVGGLVATTVGIDKDNFAKGKMIFDKAGNPSAVIRNDGNIKIADGGLALFVGPNVINNGLIEANLGKVQLASGDAFTVDMYGDGLLSVQASDQLTQQLVKNSGTIKANGGKVLLTAAAAQSAIESVINMDGLIQANSVGSKGGTVVLSGSKSTTLVSGKIEAKGNGTKGGNVDVLGKNVAILSGATVDASGDTGGGKIRIGGDFHGEGDTPTAQSTIVQSASDILANALVSGNGGDVTVWADNYAVFAGNIEAKGANGGKGGFVETSGKNVLEASGRVLADMWLLDPNNITISTSAPANVSGNPSFTTTANSGNVQASSIKANLDAGTSVTITTGTGGTNTQPGNITVQDDINKTAGGDASLTLNAHNDIIFSGNSNITSTSGKLNVTLNADKDATGGGAVVMNSNSSIETNGGDIVIGGGGNPLTTAAIGHAGQVDGVDLDGALLNAAGGNISIRGQGLVDTNSDRRGVRIRGGAVVQTNGNGTITIVGNGGGGAAGDGNYGVQLLGTGSTVTAVNGAINITGTGGGSNIATSKDNHGIVMNNNTTVSSTGSGAINLTAIAGGDQLPANNNEAIHIFGGTNSIGGASATGTITVAADTIDLANTLVVRTSGTVNLKPTTNSTTIGIAGGAGILQLTSALMNSITAGHINVGSTAGTGAITANAYTWGADASLLNGSGDININGVQTMGGHTFLADTVSGDITIGASGGVTSNASGDAIILAASGGDFFNNAGAGALSTPSGRWLIYSTNPANNTLGGLTNDFYRYSCTFGGSCPAYPASGNGLLYSYSPIITVTLNPQPASTTYGQAAPTFSYTFSGYNGGDEAADARTGAAVLSTNYVVGNDVGQYNITADAGTLASSLGYTFQGSTLVNGLTVNKADLTVNAGSHSIVYGVDPFSVLSFSTIGLYSGDTTDSFGVGLTNVPLNSGSGSGHLKVGNYDTTTLVADGAHFKSSNYNITNNTGTLNVTPKDVIISATADDKIYDGNTGAVAHLTNDSPFAGDDLTQSYTSADFNSKNVLDANLVTVNGISISGNDAGNYNLVNNSTTATAHITPFALTVSATADDKVYDGNTSAVAHLSNNGPVAGDDLTQSYTSADFNSKNVLDANLVTVNGISISGTDASNYALQNTSTTATAHITPLGLTVSATADNKPYDGTTTAVAHLTNDSPVGTDDLTQSYTSADFNSKNVLDANLVTVNGISISGTDASNYTLLNTTATANASITAKNMTVTAKNRTLTYGAANTFNGFTSSGAIAGETVTGVDFATDADAHKSTSGHWSAGTWNITPSNATGTNFIASNYAINYQDGTLKVNKKLLLAVPHGVDKTYDATTTAEVTFTDNRVSGDVFGEDYTANFNNKNVGNNKLVTVTNISLSGTDAGNYTLINPFGFTLADITKAILNITAQNVTRTYGAANTFNGYAIDGLQGGETVGNVNLSTDADLSHSNHWAEGTWSITASGASGGTFNINNYAVNYNSGTLKINPKLLLAVPHGVDKTYDATTAADVTFTDNRISGDVFDENYTANFINKNAGNNKLVFVTGISLSGDDAHNYKLINPIGITIADIDRAALTITAKNQTQPYGAGKTLTQGVIVDGLQGTETIGPVTLSTNATDSMSNNWNAGSWNITPSNVQNNGNSSSGFIKSNYNITYQNGTLTVTPITLAVNANSQTKVYGTADPTLTYTFGTPIEGEGGGLTNTFVPGDDASLFNGQLVRNEGEHVINGPYAINLGTLNAGGNYVISYTGANLTITPASLNVFAQNKIMDMGNPTIPPLTFSVNGLANGDGLEIFTGDLATTSPQSLPGFYPITQGTLNNNGTPFASTDYVLTFHDGELFIRSPFDTNTTAEQLSQFLSFRGPSGPNTLLAISNGSGGPIGTGGGLGNLAPAAGGENPGDLGDLTPSAGGNTFALIECDENNPCDAVQ